MDSRDGAFNVDGSCAQILGRGQLRLDHELFVFCPVLVNFATDDLIPALGLVLKRNHRMTEGQEGEASRGTHADRERGRSLAFVERIEGTLAGGSHSCLQNRGKGSDRGSRESDTETYFCQLILEEIRVQLHQTHVHSNMTRNPQTVDSAGEAAKNQGLKSREATKLKASHLAKSTNALKSERNAYSRFCWWQRMLWLRDGTGD